MRVSTIKWTSSKLGGGGYITGLVQSPLSPREIFARCDVAGVFRSRDGGRSWVAINQGMTECHHHMVQSIAVSPHEPNLLFRCSGDARENRIFGTVHRSEDGGESWTEVCGDVDFYGNGPIRMYGEVIGVSPFDPAIVLAGGYSAGIWRSTDRGVTWSYAGLRGERICCLFYHPGVQGVVYACSFSDQKLLKRIAEYRDVPRGMTGKLFRSEDNGATWTLLHEGPDMTELAIHPKRPDTLWAACREAGILKSEDGGVTWSPAMDGLPDDVNYSTVALSPHDPDVLYTIPNLGGQHVHLDPIAVYRSSDGGKRWSLVKEHTEADMTGYPSYMTIRHAGWAVSKLRVDLHEPGKLLLSNWYGVALSPDGGASWDANGYAGMETICAEHIRCDDAFGRIYLIAADHTPSVSVDGGVTYTAFPRTPGYTDSTALAASRHVDGFVLFGMRSRSKHRGCVIVRTKDGGGTTEIVKSFEEGFVQALEEDPTEAGKFFALVEGPISEGAGLYRTEDWGESWQQLPSPFPPEAEFLPRDRALIEEELLPVVVWQRKNVCGSNHLLRCDPHEPGALIVGERFTGLYRSGDRGATWTFVGEGLPLLRTRSSLLIAIVPDKRQPGVWYAGLLQEGLWRTQDGGFRWEKVFPLDGRPFNASAVGVGGPNGSAVVVASEPLYGAPCDSAVWYSADGRSDWIPLQDEMLGAVRWKGIDLDAAGRVHGASCGNGCYRTEPVAEAMRVVNREEE